MRWAHHLLRHHQIVCLWTVYSFLTLDRADAKLCVWHATTANLANWANTANSCRHLGTLTSELLYSSWSVRAIFTGNFWTVALESHHSCTDSNNLIVTYLSLAIREVLIATCSDASLMTLISKSTAHHRLLGWSLSNHMMTHVTANCHTIIFNNCNTTWSRKMRRLTHALVILLGLNNMATEHLWILDLNLRIVENIIIVVDVLYYFNRLIPFLFLWLWRATSSLMRSV